MMKRSASGGKEENYEHVLMCLICRSLFDEHDHQPKFLPCHHTFCKDCLREYVRQMGDEIECPSCRKIANVPAAGVAALQTNFYVKYIQSLVQGGAGITGSTMECSSHSNEKLQLYCRECNKSICRKCEASDCSDHSKVPLTTITEESHQKLDTAFAAANATIEAKKVQLESYLKAFSHEKDQALLKIDSTFEQHTHTLNRRATLLKNKVIDIYNEHVEKLECDLEEISTAMTCIVSLKDYHETKFGQGQFVDTDKGIEEMKEVHENINTRINPTENHILFEEKHGMDKFRACAKDLGRVRGSRPSIPRSDPEGGGAVKPNSACTPSSPDPKVLTSPEPRSQTAGNIVPVQPPGTPPGNRGPRILSPQGDGNGNVATGVRAIPQPRSRSIVTNASIQCKSDTNGPTTFAGTSALERASQFREKTLSSFKSTDSESSCSISLVKAEPQEVTSPDSDNGGHALPADGSSVDQENNSVFKQADTNDDLVQDPMPYSGPNKQDFSLDLHTLEPSTIKVDKAYYHLLYTSYDEEELLKELKSGKSPADLVQLAIKNSSEQKTQGKES